MISPAARELRVEASRWERLVVSAAKVAGRRRSGFWFRKIAPSPNFADCSSSAARLSAVIALHLVEGGDEALALLRRELGARAGGVQDVEGGEVGDQALARPAGPRAEQDDQPLVHRLAQAEGALALTEQRRRRRGAAQAIDEVGHRGDRLGREPGKALAPEALCGAGRKGRAASRQRSSESRVGSWKIVGASFGGITLAIAASAAAAWVVRLIARVDCLPPPHRRGEGVDDRLDPRLCVPRRAAPQLEEVPGGLSVAAARAEVDLDHPVGDALPVQVGLDPLQRVAVGIDEEAAVPGADQVREHRHRGLGLAVARAAGDVGEEGLGGFDADQALAVLGGDLAERHQVGSLRLEIEEGRGRR